MINELYELSKAMKDVNIFNQAQHTLYIPLPNVTKKAPCIQILLSGSDVVGLSQIQRETAVNLRKYGNNQGTYPAMNLAPLYRITEEEPLKQLNALRSGEKTDFDMVLLKSWCKDDNWNAKFLKKYKNCFKKAKEIQELLQFDLNHPIHQLCRQTVIFENPKLLHKALESRAFHMLEEKKDIPTAIWVLFYFGQSDKEASADFGTLSVILDSTQLRDIGYSTITSKFTQKLNEALLSADAKRKGKIKSDSVDAFGREFAAVKEKMPSVKLPGGFTVTLRTMFEEQHCQYRYGRIEDASYPIAPELRIELQSALAWISAEKQNNITWTNLNKNEILFAYPESFPALPVGLASVFQRAQSFDENDFIAAAKRFLETFEGAKSPNTDSKSDYIRIFILRKLDKARTKIVYTYNTTAKEVERCSESWWKGSRNLPKLTDPFRSEDDCDLFPLEAAAVMNYLWKRDATIASDKFKPFSPYHGIELFFNDRESVRYDLNVLIRNLEPAAVALGAFTYKFKANDDSETIVKFRKSFLLLGLLLDRLGSRKEQYMQEFPYLYGQLLKVSDALHVLYSRVVRGENQIPMQLVGGSLYNAAAEMPLRTLAQLGQRMIPYILWAKAYQYQKVSEQGKESWMAGWYLRIYEALANQLADQMENRTKFTETEHAQMFIGYLAALSQKENDHVTLDAENMNGGTNYES